MLMMNNNVRVTDIDAEYMVNLVKYHFEEFIVFEFKIQNNMENIILQDVSVEMEINSEDLKVAEILEASKILAKSSAFVYVSVAKNPELKMVQATASAFLKYHVHEIDENTTYDDEYQLEEIEIQLKDYMQPVQAQNFNGIWDKIPSSLECVDSYQLPYKNIEVAIQGLTKHFGLAVCENSDKIDASKSFHSLKLSGAFVNEVKVLVNAIIGFDPKMGCVLKLSVKSSDQSINELICNSING